MKVKKLYIILSLLLVPIFLFTLILTTSCKKSETDTEQANLGSTLKYEGVEIFIPPEAKDSQSEITVKEITQSLPQAPVDSTAIGKPYNITSEKKLSGPVLITLSYGQNSLPAGVSEEYVYIAPQG